MKINNTITVLFAALGFLTGCSDDITGGNSDTNRDAIILRAGISEGGAGVMTRAGAEENNHTTPGHVNFTSGTKLTLRVDGTWTGHTPEAVTKTTTATTGATTGADNKHNVVTFSTTSTPVEQLYWDDYGTADPANASTGRTTGLTIFGAAINGVATAPSITSWTAQTWNVGEPNTGVIDQTGGWSAKDLLTSNNVQTENGSLPYSTDGTYKFEQRDAGKLLEFTHAMTKITVNLTAGEGFPGWSSSTPNEGKFDNTPSVVLKGFNYIGKVDIEGKTSTPTQADGTTETTPVATADIRMHTVTGGNVHIATLDALVFPGNQFSATIANDAPKYTPTSATDILELNADGNIYKVTAAQLVKAIAGTGTTGTPVNGTLEQGKNYILNITVNKTDIEVTATIKNWEDVNTEEAAPKINVTATYGYTAGTVTGSEAFTKDYDLFRSTTKATGYDEDTSADGIQYAARYTSPNWDKTIYWPDHQTHYFFRGVYPQVGAVASGTTLPDEAVTTVSTNDVIAVANATYTEATYPSDLAIAIPRGTTPGSYDETCKVAAHSSKEGICATEGVINMNFEYAMSKVEVRLKSTATGQGHIALTKDNTKVEIIRGYSKARIKLSDGLHDAYANEDKGDYTLSNLTTSVTGFLVTTLDAIVPQVIGNDVIFRITVTNDNGTVDDTSDDTTDVYECKVNLINVKDTTTPVTEWAHGKHYIYELDLNKTAINVTATLKNWVEITASDNVWF